MSPSSIEPSRTRTTLAAPSLLLALMLVGMLLLAWPAAAQSDEVAWSFDADAPGALPEGAELFDGAWAIQAQEDTSTPPNALCQTGTSEFPALSLGEATYADLVIAARFKPISGQEDQAGGLLFRIQDRNNYYILRANALENNVNFYKYAGGRRSLIKEARVPVASGQWQALKVEAMGGSFRGYLNDQPVVEASDDSYQVCRVGLWTKADSTTCFDDVAVRAL